MKRLLENFKSFINEENDNSNMVIAIFGPTGTGKTTIKKYFVQKGWREIKSHTTRPERTEELSEDPKQGEYKYYRDPQEFDDLHSRGEMFNVRGYYGHKYGTLAEEFSMAGKSVMMTDLDSVRGLRQVSGMGLGNVSESTTKDVHFIFCKPQRETVERALRTRGKDSEERVDMLPEEIESHMIKVRQLKTDPDFGPRIHEVVCLPKDLDENKIPDQIVNLEKKLSLIARNSG